jgi:hypothetical protein
MQENVGNITFANDGKVEFTKVIGRIEFTSFISLHICPSCGDLHSDTTFTSSSE